ncbi:MAG: OmpH family outer membrane protein [Thiomargarita sp.]|nr:OmpH family outer membrane protein [Thiomargarita sp.]
MKIRTFTIFTILLFSIFSFPAVAELKVGFVNAIRLMEEAPQVDKANNRLEREFSPKQRRIVSDKQGIIKKEEQFKKNATIMNDAEKRRKSREIRDKKRELKRKQEEFKEDYNIRRNEELDKIQKTITQAIQKLAKEKSYDFILSDGVVWASKRVDITEEILSRLHQIQAQAERNRNRRK